MSVLRHVLNCTAFEVLQLTLMKMKTVQSDVSNWLIDVSKRANTLEQDREWLNGDAVTIIIAGR